MPMSSLILAMDRFYTDLFRLGPNNVLNSIVLVQAFVIPLIHLLCKQLPQSEQDCDLDMVDTSFLSSPVSLLRDSSNVNRLSFDDMKLSKPESPLISPLTPTSQNRKLSVSTASPTSYFLDDSSCNSPAITESLNQATEWSSSHLCRPLRLILPPPPSPPLAWVWQCHMCRSRYPLSVTRRCLLDGHYYCSGHTTQRSGKRHKGNKSCTSEFDYVGWQSWGQWRRKHMALTDYAAGADQGRTLQGCEGCNFPSQCRYENRPAKETLDFGEYITEEDLRTTTGNEAAGLTGFEKPKHNESLFDKAKATQASAKGGEAQNLPGSTNEATKGKKKVVKINQHSNMNSNKPSSKRQRFYSSFRRTESNNQLNAIRENRGRFDTSLPSISKSDSSNASLPSESKERKSEIEELDTSPRAALANQSSAFLWSPNHISTSIEDQALPPQSGRSMNSRLINRELENAVEDTQPCNTAAAGITIPPIVHLPKTTSYQDMLSDLFRRAKGGEEDEFRPANTNLAASEAEITAFLRPDATTPDARPVSPRVERNTAKTFRFENISLSSVEPR